MSTCPLLLAPESDAPTVDRSPADDEADHLSVSDAGPAQPVGLDGRQADHRLLEAFARARRRLRGAVVAFSDRTTISNAAASELLQPEDRRLLWELARSGGARAAYHDAPFVLANGMTVYRSSYPVEVDACLVGVVLHLRVAPPTRAKLVGAVIGGSVDLGGAVRSIRPAADPALLTGWSDLTDSERTVAELVGQGLSNKQAGRRLFISPHTVDYHLRRIYRKLGITSRVELARLLGEHYESLADATAEDRIA